MKKANKTLLYVEQKKSMMLAINTKYKNNFLQNSLAFNTKFWIKSGESMHAI